MIAVVDLLAGYRELQAEINEAVQRVLLSGQYIGGPEVFAFEESFAEYCGAQACVGVGNGFDALHLILRALNIGPGHEVIVASNSFAATVLAVTATGAEPVLVEPDAGTFNLDPEKVESAITSRTRVILPTHLYGQPADLDALASIAARFKLFLVEDAAQAHGARYKGQRIGAFGEAVAWSFYPTKNLGALGDAGAVTTRHPHLARTIRTLANYGSRDRHRLEVCGVNSRMDPVQAAILRAKLPRLDDWNDRRRSIASAYSNELSTSSLSLPEVPDWAEAVWHVFAILTPRRDALRAWLSTQAIGSDIHYPVPPHLQEAYRATSIGSLKFPIAERLAKELVSLPIGPHLQEDDVPKVVQAIKQWEHTAGV